MTAAEVAGAAKLGRSTASKVLARLADSGKVARVRGGRDGARRLPDRFSLSGKPTRAIKRQAAGAATNGSGGERLKPGQLDGLVIAFLKKNDDSAPHSPDWRRKRIAAVIRCGRQLSRPPCSRQAGATGQRQAASLQPRGVAAALAAHSCAPRALRRRGAPCFPPEPIPPARQLKGVERTTPSRRRQTCGLGARAGSGAASSGARR
jgi:hypothetical protein